MEEKGVALFPLCFLIASSHWSTTLLEEIFWCLGQSKDYGIVCLDINAHP